MTLSWEEWPREPVSLADLTGDDLSQEKTLVNLRVPLAYRARSREVDHRGNGPYRIARRTRGPRPALLHAVQSRRTTPWVQETMATRVRPKPRRRIAHDATPTTLGTVVVLVIATATAAQLIGLWTMLGWVGSVGRWLLAGVL